jgi:hypothetical protein
VYCIPTFIDACSCVCRRVLTPVRLFPSKVH